MKLTVTIPGKLDPLLTPNRGQRNPRAKAAVRREWYNYGNEIECRSDGGTSSGAATNSLRGDGDMKYRTPFSPTEDQFIRDHVGSLSHREIGERLDRPTRSIRNRASAIGAVNKDHLWTQDEVDLLVRWYETHPLNADFDLDGLAQKLGRHKTNVSRKARSLGLTDIRRSLVPEDQLKTIIITLEDGTKVYKRRTMFASPQELFAHHSKSRKEWFLNNPHPRGALGMTHTQETRERIGEKAREWWEKATPLERELMFVRRNMTMIDRYGSAGPQVSNPYSRGHRGYIEDIPDTFFRSGWEANYARYLNWLKDQGEIQDWSYEPETFIFHGVTRAPINYTPDFRIVERDGSVVFHEVKGWMDGKSKSKLKRMAKFYPDVQVIVVDESAYKSVAKWSGVIPHWGDMPRTKKQMEEDAASRSPSASMTGTGRSAR